ncbi:hypothetical protein KM043_009852 [Ampulex compressa]|nr:hypothetical protein KM043_009852 [Ampulex compressa]
MVITMKLHCKVSTHFEMPPKTNGRKRKSLDNDTEEKQLIHCEPELTMKISFNQKSLSRESSSSEESENLSDEYSDAEDKTEPDNNSWMRRNLCPHIHHFDARLLFLPPPRRRRTGRHFAFLVGPLCPPPPTSFALLRLLPPASSAGAAPVTGDVTHSDDRSTFFRLTPRTPPRSQPVHAG